MFPGCRCLVAPEKCRGTNIVEFFQRAAHLAQQFILMALLQQFLEFHVDRPEVAFELVKRPLRLLDFLSKQPFLLGEFRIFLVECVHAILKRCYL